AGTVAARQERKSARGNRFAFVGLSDPTGLYETVVFSDVLEEAREHLEPGRNVVLSVEATMEADQLKLLCRSAQPADDSLAGAGPAGGLRVFVGAASAMPVLRSILDRSDEAGPKGRGPILVTLLDPGLPGEVDLSLGESLPVSPQVRGALKAVPGVLTIEDLETV
ncbi:MAG: DNA polymerase III subunit alpha, partial [Pseudomonadota bacterium]